MLPEINDYTDIISKLDYDIKRYTQNAHIYELVDCLLTLNALPEWIVSSIKAKPSLVLLANNKIIIMKGSGGFVFDENKLDSDMDHKLRFVRLICNHSKHKTNSGHIPVIKTISDSRDTGFPYVFPVIFYKHRIVIGSKSVDAEILINEVTDFWKKEIARL